MKKIDRLFCVGTSWTYFKLYMSETEANRILSTRIFSLIKKLKKEGIIDVWFFIRYYDPDFHIRLRCHLTDNNNYQKVMSYLNENIKNEVKRGYIYKTACDTYIREINRYGKLTILFSEYLFQISSEQTIFLIRSFTKSGENLAIQAIFPALIIDCLLDTFGFSINRKQDLLEKMWISFAAEFKYSSENKRLLSKKYREIRPILNSLLNREVCNKQTAYIERTNAAFKDRIKKEHLKEEMFNNDIITSYIHMILNRYYNFAQRAHELVIYYSLYNYYKSAIMRFKNENKKNINILINL